MENVFNLDSIKQAVDICFSNKRRENNYPSITFNGDDVQKLKASRSNFRF